MEKIKKEEEDLERDREKSAKKEEYVKNEKQERIK